jgi:hypothetical protein
MYPQNASSCSSLIPLGGDEVGMELRVDRWGGRLNDIVVEWVLLHVLPFLVYISGD